MNMTDKLLLPIPPDSDIYVLACIRFDDNNTTWNLAFYKDGVWYLKPYYAGREIAAPVIGQVVLWTYLHEGAYDTLD
jgi:hypothetical protein